jgi:hypothetical protein
MVAVDLRVKRKQLQQSHVTPSAQKGQQKNPGHFLLPFLGRGRDVLVPVSLPKTSLDQDPTTSLQPATECSVPKKKYLGSRSRGFELMRLH